MQPLLPGDQLPVEGARQLNVGALLDGVVLAGLLGPAVQPLPFLRG